MFMFILEVPKEDNSKRFKPISENEYFYNEYHRLKDHTCPNCFETNSLFRGGVFIGCRSCFCYFGINDDGGLVL